jgi:hypothetical protein
MNLSRRADHQATISRRRRNAQMATISPVSKMQALAISHGIVSGATPSMSP